MLFQRRARRAGQVSAAVVISIASRCYSNREQSAELYEGGCGRDLYSVTMLFQQIATDQVKGQDQMS